MPRRCPSYVWRPTAGSDRFYLFRCRSLASPTGTSCSLLFGHLRSRPAVSIIPRKGCCVNLDDFGSDYSRLIDISSPVTSVVGDQPVVSLVKSGAPMITSRFQPLNPPHSPVPTLSQEQIMVESPTAHEEPLGSIDVSPDYDRMVQIPDANVVACGFHDATLVDMLDTAVTVGDLGQLQWQWPVSIVSGMAQRQTDVARLQGTISQHAHWVLSILWQKHHT